MRRRWAFSAVIAAIVACVDVAIAVAAGVVTNDSLPRSLQPFRPWAWPSLAAAVTILGIAAALVNLLKSAGPDSGAPPIPLVSTATNIRSRNSYFTGREDLLRDLRRSLTQGRAVAVVAQPDGRRIHAPPTQALLGIPGVGKTEIALEYVHRYAHKYKIRWWINAEDASGIGAQLIELGDALGIGMRSGSVTPGLVRAELNRRSGWLLVFDNSGERSEIERFLPDIARGHLIVTSRNQGWRTFGRAVAVDRFSLTEGAENLRRRLREHLGDVSDVDLRALADDLDCLPLALAQAASYIVRCDVTVSQFRALLAKDPVRVLDQDPPDSYPRSFVKTYFLAFNQVRERSPAAWQLLTFLAFLDPDSIPESLVKAAAATMPEPLKHEAGDDVARTTTIGVLQDYSLVQRERRAEQRDYIRIHRQVQKITRDLLSPSGFRGWVERVITTMDRINADDNASAPDVSPHWTRLWEYREAAHDR